MKLPRAESALRIAGWQAEGRCRSKLGRVALLPALAALCVVVTGCQTFNYTDEDLARERKKLAESWASGGWRGFGCGSGINISPNLGNIGCPGLGGGCPGK